MSTLTELGDYIEGLGLGTQAVDLFLGSRPDSPDQLIALYQYAGGPPEYVQSSFSPTVEVVQIQVVARSIAYEDADALASAVWTALAIITNATLGSTRYRSVRPNASPGLMGRDSNDRILVSFNTTVEKEVSLDIVS